MPIKPIAPFEKDGRKATAMVFDRETGSPVSPSTLRTYANALVRYHISPEFKFRNGEFLHRGMTHRRHVQMANVLHIGKEAPDWERDAMLGLNADAAIGYGNRTGIIETISALIAEFGSAQTAKAVGLSSRQLETIACHTPKRAKNRIVHSLAVKLPESYEGVAAISGGATD